MIKELRAIEEVAKPHQEKLEKFIRDGGTVTEFAIAYPFDAGVLYGLTQAAMTIYTN